MILASKTLVVGSSRLLEPVTISVGRKGSFSRSRTPVIFFSLSRNCCSLRGREEVELLLAAAACASVLHEFSPGIIYPRSPGPSCRSTSAVDPNRGNKVRLPRVLFYTVQGVPLTTLAPIRESLPLPSAPPFVSCLRRFLARLPSQGEFSPPTMSYQAVQAET